jgi:hypothetical protein
MPVDDSVAGRASQITTSLVATYSAEFVHRLAHIRLYGAQSDDDVLFVFVARALASIGAN